MSKIGILAVGTVLAAAGAAGAQMFLSIEGRFETFGTFEWSPSCDMQKPTMVFDRSDASRQIYLQQVNEYVDCVTRQANNDAQGAVAAVKAGRDKALDDMSEQVKQDWR